jgi:hypothetical protein
MVHSLKNLLSIFLLSSNKEPVSSVGIARGYGLDDRGSIPGRSNTFSSLCIVQAGSGTHPDSYPMGTGNFLTGVKRLGREADHSSPSSEERWSYISTPP